MPQKQHEVILLYGTCRERQKSNLLRAALTAGPSLVLRVRLSIYGRHTFGYIQFYSSKNDRKKEKKR